MSCFGFGFELIRGLSAVMLAGGLAWASYGLARRWSLTPTARLAGSIVAVVWLAISIFWLLAPWNLFRLPVVMVVVFGLAIALGRGSHAGDTDQASQIALLASDVSRGTDTIKFFWRSPSGWVLIAVTALSAIRALRGTVTPPLGWDALTYHLLKAARFVQAGGVVSESAPDAWRYYEYYPPTGDIVWAWAMLPVRGDALLSLAGWGLWLAAIFGVWACAREIGARRDQAALASAAIGALPSALSYLSSAYVDIMVLALFSLGSFFVLRIAKGQDPHALKQAPFAAGALGLMVGVKLTAAPFFALGAVVVLWRLARPYAATGPETGLSLGPKLSAKTRTWILVVAIAAAAAGAPPYLRSLAERGSPVWPFTVKIADTTLFQGDPGMQKLAEGELLTERYQLPSRTEFWNLFVWKRTSEGAFVNPGPGGLIILTLALIALPGLLRRKETRNTAIFLAACGVVMLAGAMSKNMELFRTTVKAATFGRYLLPAFAAAAVIAAGGKGRIHSIGLAIAAIAGLFVSWPRGWQPIETSSMILGLAAFGSLAVAALLLGSTLGSKSPRRLVIAVIATIVASLGVQQIQATAIGARYLLWEAAAKTKRPLFHMHRLHPIYAGAWPIWQGLDDPTTPRRLAVTAGWDRLGHNWYRYPLLGSRFQNQVVYIPITPDGSVVDYRIIGRADTETAQRAGSLPHWLARLAQAEIEVVVSLAPRWTVEDSWMQTRPDLFTPILGDERGFHVAYRFDREAAIAWLNEMAQR